MKKQFNKCLSFFLAFAMILTCSPLTHIVYADESEQTYSFDFESLSTTVVDNTENAYNNYFTLTTGSVIEIGTSATDIAGNVIESPNSFVLESNGTYADNSLVFTTSSAAAVSVWTVANDLTASSVSLVNAEDDSVIYPISGGLTGTRSFDDNPNAAAETVWLVNQAGTYYIAANNGAASFFRVTVTETGSSNDNDNDDNNDMQNTDVEIISITADGEDGIETSTKLTVTFDNVDFELLNDEINISGDALKSGDIVSLGNGIYEVPITVSANGTAIVELVKEGYNFAGLNSSEVYWAEIDLSNFRLMSAPLNFSLVSAVADGWDGQKETTYIQLTFDMEFDDLPADAIAITGNATKGTVVTKIDNFTWRIKVASVSATGNAVVTVSDFSTYTADGGSTSQTVTVSKGRIFDFKDNAAAFNAVIFNANDLSTSSSAVDSTTASGFTYKGNSVATADKTSDAANDTTLTLGKYLNLNGALNAGTLGNSVQFTVTDAPKTVYAYALQTGTAGGADRYLGLYKLPMGANLASSTRITAIKDNVPVGSILTKCSYEITENGTYALGSVSSGQRLYAVVVLDPVVENQSDWNDLDAPSISNTRQIDGSIVITFNAPFGAKGFEEVVAKLYKKGTSTLISRASFEAAGDIEISPIKSGDYTIVLEGRRKDQKNGKSTTVDFNGYVLPLAIPVVGEPMVTSVQGNLANVNVSWSAVTEADSYELQYREQGAPSFTLVSSTLTKAIYTMSNLTVGTTYEFKVIAKRGSEKTESTTADVTVAGVASRWSAISTGSGSKSSLSNKSLADLATSDDAVIVNDDGSIILHPNSGTKMATSEDGFVYYYTVIDPDSENFTLTADFEVIAPVSGVTLDNQSGFGIIAVDSIIPFNGDARYFNSAGSLVARLDKTETDGTLTMTRYGMPGGRFISGYSEAPNVLPTTYGAMRDVTAVEAFDWNYTGVSGKFTANNERKFETGDVFTLRLRKSNSGYHASMLDTAGNVIGEERVWYEPDALLQQDPDKYYLGFFASRNTRVKVSNYTLTTIHPDDDDAGEVQPDTLITPTFSFDTTTTTSQFEYDLGLLSNVNGTYTIKDSIGNVIVSSTEILAGKRAVISGLSLNGGVNNFTAVLSPYPNNRQSFGPKEKLASTDNVELSITVTVKRYGTIHNMICVSPDGKSTGDGTRANPLDIYTAVSYAQPGQQIVLMGGTYNLTKALTINRGLNGTSSNMITLMSEPNSKAILDLTNSSNGGISLKGDYWHIYNLEIINSRGNTKPMLISGNHNRVERLSVHDNGDSGIQISGSANEPYELWPSYNVVMSCESYNNADPQGNDADGFAVKLTVGDGNILRYCIAHHNIDDGYDFYAKTTSGSIGRILLIDSVAYRNGFLTSDPGRTKTGEGNGFKLGGESMPGKHILWNSISFDNIARGITSNSGADCEAYYSTSYNNWTYNYNMYTSNPDSDWEAKGVLTYSTNSRTASKDQTAWKGDRKGYVKPLSNFFDGKSGSVSVDQTWFESLNVDTVPTYNDDGSINMYGLLELTATGLTSANGAGAIFTSEVNRNDKFAELIAAANAPGLLDKTATANVFTSIPEPMTIVNLKREIYNGISDDTVKNVEKNNTPTNEYKVGDTTTVSSGSSNLFINDKNSSTTANLEVNGFSTKVNGITGTAKITASIPDELIKKIKNAHNKDEHINVVVNLGDSDILNAINSKEVKIVSIIIPVQSFDNVTISEIVIGKDAINKAKELNVDIKITVKDANGTDYQWNISPDGSKATSDFNLNVDTAKVSDYKGINDIISGSSNNGMVIGFGDNIPYGASAAISVKDLMGGNSDIKSGQKVYIYRFNESTGKFEETVQNSTKVSTNGYINIANVDNGNYVVLTNKLESNLVTPVQKQLKLSISKSTSKIKVKAPRGLESVKEFDPENKNLQVVVTYSSSDEDVAKISSDGVITYSGEGNTKVTVTYKLSNGKTSRSKFTLNSK